MMERLVTLPENLREPVATAIVEWTNPMMFSLSERLQDLGLSAPDAVQIEIHALVTWAARIGVLSALVIEKREPNAEWWQNACREAFEQALTWHAENYRPERESA